MTTATIRCARCERLISAGDSFFLLDESFYPAADDPDELATYSLCVACDLLLHRVFLSGGQPIPDHD